LSGTRDLARRYGVEAIKVIRKLKESADQKRLVEIVEQQLERQR